MKRMNNIKLIEIESDEPDMRTFINIGPGYITPAENTHQKYREYSIPIKDIKNEEDIEDLILKKYNRSKYQRRIYMKNYMKKYYKKQPNKKPTKWYDSKFNKKSEYNRNWAERKAVEDKKMKETLDNISKTRNIKIINPNNLNNQPIGENNNDL